MNQFPSVTLQIMSSHVHFFLHDLVSFTAHFYWMSSKEHCCPSNQLANFGFTQSILMWLIHLFIFGKCFFLSQLNRIQSLSQEQQAWGGNTPWIEHQSSTRPYGLGSWIIILSNLLVNLTADFNYKYIYVFKFKYISIRLIYW